MSGAPPGGGETDGPLIFLVAGEPSGDQLGARLMAALKEETGGKVRFAGVGGSQMTRQGLTSLFPIEDLAVMGIFEVLPLVIKVYRRVRHAVAAVERLRPDAVVTIDSPSFTLEISQRLKGRVAPLIHYVAPSVWAWKAWRAKHIAKFLDHLLALLPFEPPYFERHGLATTVVGHPAVEADAVTADPVAFRARHGLPPEAPLVCVLPGSRKGEVKRHEPVMAEALAILKQRFPDLRAVVPTVPTVAAEVAARAAAWPVPALVLEDPAEKYQAFAAAEAAMATSGTVAVELAVAGVPVAILYRVGPMTAIVGRALLEIKYASIVNLLLDRPVQPELLQERCTPTLVAETVAGLIEDPDLRAAYRADCDAAAVLLGRGEEVPSLRAARRILELIGEEATGRRADPKGSPA